MYRNFGWVFILFPLFSCFNNTFILKKKAPVWKDCTEIPKLKNECGHIGLYEYECRALNCCWKQSTQFGKPSCFFPGDNPKPRSEREKVGPPTYQPTHSRHAGPWTDAEIRLLHRRWLQNFDFDRTGAVIQSQDEKTHRVRDAAISISILLDVGGDDGRYDDVVKEYVRFVEKTQKYMDSPIFDLDAQPCCDDWLKGSELSGNIMRALALMKFADRIAASRDVAVRDYCKERIWPLIRKDVKYIHEHRNELQLDFWGETRGDHFFIKLLTRCAIYLGTKFADQFADTSLLGYDMTVEDLGLVVQDHAGAGIVRETWPPVQGAPFKKGNVDVASIFGAIFTAQATDSFFQVSEPAVQRSASMLMQIFANVDWEVQTRDTAYGVPGFLYGRYGGDEYNGHDRLGPSQAWVMASAAMAEYFYSTGAEMFLMSARNESLPPERRRILADHPGSPALLRSPHLLRMARFMKRTGDDTLQRLRYHVGMEIPQMVQSESGQRWGMKDHTMTYAFLFSAWNARSAIPPE